MAQMELAVLDFIQELFRNPFMDSLMPAVTSLGDAGFLWILLGLALLCSRKYRRTGAAVLLSLAADLVICRAGASTVSELTALAVPAVIVPSPYVTNNHQEKNARILEKHGGARVILEKDATGEALYRAAGEILRSPELRRSMSAGMAELGIPDATERIYRTVMALRK
jgi:UDP-N-acetylglucosamine--N-acetylmuramyl-(pentapeptide) pyrophosphoryl-undecaprenol N-acetylglucosamine transferase